MIKTMIIGVMAAWLSLSASGLRAETGQIELKLSMRPIYDRHLVDGQIIGNGKVIYQGEHRGFQVWLTADKRNGAAGRYILRGENNPSQQMLVKLEAEGWILDDGDDKGIILHGGEPRADFNIVIDGNQDVAVDSYAVVAKVRTLTSESP